MNGTKIFSRILFYITRLLAVFYFFVTALSLLALTTHWGLGLTEDGKYFHVYYPFTTKPFLNGDYNLHYIIFYFLLVLGLYGLFFLLVSNVFRVFFQPKLFTAFGVRHLKRFYLANFIIPGALVLTTSFFTEVDDSSQILVVLHFILGVFAFFLAAIFNQGLNLQKEQDLFI
jgi:hypothetical protein